MKHEDIRVGMKVRPFQKSVWNWEKESIKDYYAKQDWGVGYFFNKNGYLYVVDYDETTCDGAWVLGYAQGEEDGDYFKAEDFEPYVEEELDAMDAVQHIVNGVNEMEYISTRKELKALRAFKEYWDGLYGQGLQLANWHQNGSLEPFENFYDSAMECYDEIMEGE